MMAHMDSEALEKLRRAGRIASECREWARENIRPGVEVRYVLETVEAMIVERGGAPAFPTQSSRNQVAAHYCSAPNDPMTYEVGDCVKVDVGVHVDGYIGDTACSVDLSEDGHWQPLVDASANALKAAIATVGPGVNVREVGSAIERAIMSAGFEPIRNLTGHGLARWKVHTAPQIPNYPEGGSGLLKEGMVIAIEPFASTGRGFISERGRAEVFMMQRPPRKAKGLDRGVLDVIQSWRGLPIARRYFRDLDSDVVEDTLTKLVRQGALMRFPPLTEEDGVMTSQCEHSLFLGPAGVEVLTA